MSDKYYKIKGWLFAIIFSFLVISIILFISTSNFIDSITASFIITMILTPGAILLQYLKRIKK